MPENYFRNNPGNNVIGILQSRRGLWNSGRNGQHIKDATRDTAWAKVTINGLTLPRNDDTFQKLYGRGASSPKPFPSLESVTIRTAGEWGHAIHVEVTFTCYMRSDFELFDKNWLRTGLEGEVTFGYVKPYNGAEQTYIKLDKLYVTLFDFNTDNNAHYVCRVKLVGPSRFLEAIECKGGLNDQNKFKYKTKTVLGGTEIHDVTSIDELMLYDAQENGQTSTDDMADNHKVSSEFGDIIVYHPPSKGGIAGGFQRSVGRMLQAFQNSGDKHYTFNHEYFSLAYVCNRIVNNQLLEFLKKVTDSKSKSILSNLKVVCNEEVSRGHGYPEVRSSNPLAVLILGGGKGDYKNDGTGLGKNFETDAEGAGAGIKCHRGDYVDLSKIMIERLVICDAIEHARTESEVSDKASQNKPTTRTDVMIYVKRFLEEIFKTIAYSTGNLFQLSLIENPKNRNELLVVDSNNGNAPTISVFMFDPIDGDGSTIDMQLNSNAGSRDFMASMFGSVIKPSDINSTINNTLPEINSKRSSELPVTIEQIKKKCKVTMPDSGFGPDEIEGLRTLLVKYNQLQSSDTNKDKQVILYPGLKMSVSMHGVWGWGIGNHIHTTLCPKDPYRIESKGICFNVQHVEHKIQNNEWETSLEAIMTFAGPIKYV